MSDDAILFNTIPGSGLSAPLFSFEFNSGGQYSSAARVHLVGFASAAALAAGTIQAGKPLLVASQDQADALAGPGSMLREMYRIFTANCPSLPIYLNAVAEVGTAEVRTLTIGPLPSPGVGVVVIDGEQIPVTIGATDTPATVAASLAAAINGYYNTLTDAMLPLTASAAGPVVTVTMRHAGLQGSEVSIAAPTGYTNNLFAQPGVLTVATTTPGSGFPVVAPALAALGEDPADFVVSPFSDAASLASYTAWGNDVSGRWSWARQDYGHVWCCVTGAFAAVTTQGLSINDRHTTQLYRPPTASRPSWLWIAGYCAQHATWLADCVTGNVSRNQTGKVIQGLAPPSDPTMIPNYAARNTLINSGISTWKVDAAGNVVIDKCVTAYRAGASGQPDIVFRDIQRMYQLSGGFTYWRAVLAQEQGQKAFAQSNPGGLGAISTPADIAATCLHAYKTLCARGVFQDFDGFSAGFLAQADTQNPARCNIFAPVVGVNPLDILAANATIYSQDPSAA